MNLALATDGTAVQVRRLVVADAPRYRSLMLEAYGTCPEAFTSTLAERERQPLSWWAARLSDDPQADDRVCGAFLGDELVGAAGLGIEPCERTRHKATLFGMFVRPTVRGCGVGRRLVDAILQEARETGRLTVVQLSVSAPNAVAIALYTRCGFVACGLEPMGARYGTQYMGKLHMWQPLSTETD